MNCSDYERRHFLWPAGQKGCDSRRNPTRVKALFEVAKIGIDASPKEAE